VYELVEIAIAAAKREAEDRRGAILLPHKPALRPLITSGNAALKAVETAPPPSDYAGPDDDIPF
jgi:hypothetical protein